jgi:Dynein heavy chain, N-terminal region 2
LYPQLRTCSHSRPHALLQAFLRSFKQIKNCVAASNQEGVFKKLEEQQGELEVCEKALADFKESKRRAFPRFYFVSSNDLLDILSNGAPPSACARCLHSITHTLHSVLAP